MSNKQCNWNRIATFYVDPYNTSKICPKCNNELKESNGLHYLECKSCGFKDDRDHIAVANITKKFLKLLLNSKSLEGRFKNSTQNTPLSKRNAMK